VTNEVAPVRWPVTLEIPVAWGDMDSFGHVNNAIYLRWFESARIAYFERVALMAEMASAGTGPILARATVDFRRPVTYPDRVTVSARVPELRTTSFSMSYRATSATLGDAVVAEGESVVVMIDYRSGEKRAVSEVLRARIAELESGGDASRP
jgi:acyl-CoA thioester hydrolase